jgi:hypothetical protein
MLGKFKAFGSEYDVGFFIDEETFFYPALDHIPSCSGKFFYRNRENEILTKNRTEEPTFLQMLS